MVRHIPAGELGEITQAAGTDLGELEQQGILDAAAWQMTLEPAQRAGSQQGKYATYEAQKADADRLLAERLKTTSAQAIIAEYTERLRAQRARGGSGREH